MAEATDQASSLPAAETAAETLALTPEGKETAPAVVKALKRALVDLRERHFGGLDSGVGPALAADFLGYVRKEDRSRFKELVFDLAEYVSDGPIVVDDEGEVGIITLVGDPVALASGALLHETTDFVVRGGEGFALPFRRKYKSGVFHRGPMGHSWDHSLNLWLRVDSSGSILSRSTGALGEDEYRLHGAHGYFVPPDGVHDRIGPHGDSYLAVTPAGVRTIYQASSNPRVHLASRVEDPDGNYVELLYDEDDRLRRALVNSSDRWIQFAYDSAGRLVQISLYSVTYERCGAATPVERRWRYGYDEYDDLVEVRTAGVEGNEDGYLTRYEYSSARGPVAHLLERIVDDRGACYLENEYGVDAGLVSFRRVIRQRANSGEFLFDYRSLRELAGPDDPARPTSITTVIDSSEHATTHWFNGRGNELATADLVIDECTPRSVITASRHNRDGNLVGTVSGSGRVTQWHYGREHYYRRFPNADPADPWNDPNLTASERAAFGNLLARVRRASLTRLLDQDEALELSLRAAISSDPDDLIEKWTYESRYQRVATTSDPRFTRSADPADPETLAYASTLTRLNYGAVLPSRLIEIVYAATSYSTQLPDGTSGRGPGRDQFTAYDAHGRVLEHRDPEGVLRRMTYHPGTAGPRAGFIAATLLDPGSLALRSGVEINEAGIRIAEIDARGVRREFRVDELDRVVHRREDSGHTTDFKRDCDGRIVRQESDCLDPSGLPHPDGRLRTTSKFDEIGNLLCEKKSASRSGPAVVTRHRYDAAGRRVLTIRPRGTEICYRYDQRGRLVETTSACCTDIASTRRFQYDEDGLLLREIDGTGAITSYEYDAYARRVGMIDAHGSELRTAYDKAGNKTAEWFVERRADGSQFLLDAQVQEYDERNRCIRSRTAVFASPMATGDPTMALSDLDAALGAGVASWAETRFYVDAAGNPFRTELPSGAVELTYYDTAGRVSARIFRGGDIEVYRRDGNGNVVAIDRFDRRTGPTPSFEHTSTGYEYDSANRRNAAVDALQSRTEWSYDSLGRCVARLDALGNRQEWLRDLLGLREVQRWYMTTSGLGAGAPGNPDRIEVERIFDTHGNLVEYVEPQGRAAGAVLSFAYDLLDRSVSTRYPDGTKLSREYDREGRLIAEVSARGLRVVHTLDALGRMTRRTLLGPAVLPASGAAEFSYDGRGRTVRHENEWLRTVLSYDSQGGPLQEQITFNPPLAVAVGAVPLTIQRRFDTSGRRTDLVYSDGTALRYRFDRADRIRTVRCTHGGAAPVPFLTGVIVRHRYAGPRRTRSDATNGTRAAWIYDAAGRNIAMRGDGNAWSLELQQLHDGAGNARWCREELPGQAPTAKKYAFDSQYRLTEIGPGALPRINPNAVSGATQAAIDALLGLLGQTNAATYSYDVAGNRLIDRSSGAVVAYSPDTMNRYTTVGGDVCTFDDDGNLAALGGSAFSYGPGNELTSAQIAGTTHDLYYDAMGRLCALQSAGKVTCLVNDGPDILEEHGDRRALHFLDGGDSRCMSLISTQAQPLWVFSDGLGSIRSLSDATGALVAASSYEPFGNERIGLPAWYGVSFGGRLRIAGPVLHGRRRALHVELGRFLQRDPLGVVTGPNAYGYCGDNPLTWIDPAGLDKLTPWLRSHPRVRRVAQGTVMVVGGVVGIYAAAEAAPVTAFGLALGGTMSLSGGIVVGTAGLIVPKAPEIDAIDTLTSPVGLATTTLAATAGSSDPLALGDDVATAMSVLQVGKGAYKLISRELSVGLLFGRMSRNRRLSNAIWNAYGLQLRSPRPNPFFPRGLEYIERSHFLPRELWVEVLGDWVDRPWNLRPVWGTEHARMDPVRMGIMKREFQLAYEDHVYKGFEKWVKRAPDWLSQDFAPGALSLTSKWLASSPDDEPDGR